MSGCVPLKLLNCMVRFSMSCSILQDSCCPYFFFCMSMTMNWRASLIQQIAKSYPSVRSMTVSLSRDHFYRVISMNSSQHTTINQKKPQRKIVNKKKYLSMKKDCLQPCTFMYIMIMMVKKASMQSMQSRLDEKLRYGLVMMTCTVKKTVIRTCTVMITRLLSRSALDYKAFTPMKMTANMLQTMRWQMEPTPPLNELKVKYFSVDQILLMPYEYSTSFFCTACSWNYVEILFL